MKLFPYPLLQRLKLPLFSSTVPAGFESPATDYIEERIDLSHQLAPRPLSTFYCRSSGESMIGAHIPPNSLLIVDKSQKPVSGDIVVAYVNGGFTVKFIRYEGGKCFLVPANERFPTVEIREEMQAMIWGKVTSVVIDTKHLRACMPS